MTARRIRTILAALLAAISVMPGAGGASTFPPLPANTAVEFYHAAFDHYFITNNPAEIDALDSGRTHGVDAHRSRIPGVRGRGRVRIRQSGVPLLHSAGTRQFALLLGLARRVPGGARQDRRRPELQRLHLRVAERVLRRAARHDDRRVPGEHGAGVPAVEPARRLQPSLHDRPRHQGGDAGARVSRGRLRSGRGEPVLDRPPCSSMPSRAPRDSRRSPRDAKAYPRPASPTRARRWNPGSPSIPSNPNNLIGAWQQDRWSNGGARGLGSAYSLDGGGTWTRTSVPFSRCSGGNAANGGDYERATDPWVTFAPDGTAYQIALAFNSQRNGDNAILVARSTDGGRTWSNPVTLKRDGAANFNDKEAITADPTDARYVYAVWDRLTGNNGPTWFARTVDGGATWEPARNIYDPDRQQPDDQQPDRRAPRRRARAVLHRDRERRRAEHPAADHALDGQGRDVVGADHDRGEPEHRHRRPRDRHRHPRRLDPGLDRGRQGRHAGGRVAGRAFRRQPRRHRVQPVDRRRAHVDRRRPA